MKKIVVILLLLAVLLTIFFSIQRKPSQNSVEQEEKVFAYENSELRSPSGEYSLSLERFELNDVTSYRIAVTALDGQTIYSDELFRARDTLLVLWDDAIDRIWAYSGDVGTYYWDIYNKSLVCHTYADSKDVVVVPYALSSAKPNIFGNK